MSVLTRKKSGTSPLRRLRDVRAASPAPQLAVCRTPRPAPAGATERRRSREAERPQDEALYNCGCGFVFAAAVSTSVGCPHCGDAQAW